VEKMFVYKAARDVNDWAKYRTHQPLQRPAFFVNVRARAFERVNGALSVACLLRLGMGTHNNIMLKFACYRKCVPFTFYVFVCVSVHAGAREKRNNTDL
jgi:hypothetical protein